MTSGRTTEQSTKVECLIPDTSGNDDNHEAPEVNPGDAGLMKLFL